jgi:hypothetical protein
MYALPVKQGTAAGRLIKIIKIEQIFSAEEPFFTETNCQKPVPPAMQLQLGTCP